MRNPEYSNVDPQTGNVTYNGPLEIMKGNHNHMPAKTEAYLPGDEKGHVNASSLGGSNNPSNVVPQNSDVNHGGYLSVENGERNALQSGASIVSEKTAIVNGQPGDRPTVFTVNDTVTYADNHTESIHNSFSNESYTAQSEWNEISAALPDTFDGAANPGDSLRDSIGTTSYAELMEEADASLPNLDTDYTPADFSGLPESALESNDFADSGLAANAGGNNSVGSDPAASGDDGGADADADSE